ncbi:unnamed protein product [Larinioides sclopetarius]|uniref:acid phosphatase n=1 Tax=Larinioides sclopetarius TaxID=280406 RepID=A0AAV2A982_9ARAC
MMSFSIFPMMFSLLLFSAALVLNQSFAEESTRLLLVQTLFRHGDRAPMFLYPKDKNKLDSWPEGLGKLTRLGKKQHYAVGKFLRSMYKDFVTSNPNEVIAISTATERSLSSALAHLAALYAPEGNWKFEDELDWQPIPIYTLPTKDDKYLSFNSTCPRARQEQRKLIGSLQTIEEYQKHKTMLKAVSQYAGFNISQGINALWLYDLLMIEKIHNITLPEWANTYWNEIKELADITFHGILNSLALLRMRIGPLFKKITETMIKKIDGETDLKIQVFSAHDVNVGGALMALNFTDMPQPPYCATLLFELHEMADTTKTVRLLYLNSTDPLKDIGKPHVLVLDDCSEYCPIEIFTKKIQHLIPDDWEQECQLVTSDIYEIDKTFEYIQLDALTSSKKDEL